MQICEAHIAIGADLRNVVFKRGITAAEIAVLRHIHGESSVHRIVVKDWSDAPLAVERDRLKEAYPEYKDVVNAIWRDNGGALPTDVREVGLHPDLIESIELGKGRRPAPPQAEPAKRKPRIAAPNDDFKIDSDADD